MSIFKDTLPTHVQNQLRAREIIVSQASGSKVTAYGTTPRSGDFMRYTTGKNSWVRMTSFVDCVNSGVKIGSKTYTGDQLAKKYILEGGTLAEDSANPGSGVFGLRYGLGYPDAVYASNIDDGGDRQYGYRPMPGITSVSIINKSAYGSLREATVKFYAWDKHQLEELELLYMRTGYSVLLEWGWSQYLDSSDLTKVGMKNFDAATINAFKISPNLTGQADEAIYNQIDKFNKEAYGNYDGMLGYVKNFSWSILPNGGFECTTVLISRGEVLSSLKLSTNSGVINISSGTTVSDQATVSQFEGILLNYSALINEAELDPGGQFGPVTTSGGGTNPLSSQITTSTKDKFLSDLIQKADRKGTDGVTLYKDSGGEWNSTLQAGINDPNLNYYGGTLPTRDTTNTAIGYGIEYIRFDMLIALMNIYFNYKDKNNQVVADIRIPDKNLCLAAKDTVSADPTTCLIKNSKAKGILLQDTKKGSGFIPNLVRNYNSTSATSTPLNIEEFLVSGSNNKAYIKHIYVAVPKVLEIFRSKLGNSSEVSLSDFLKDLLSQISRALGGVNNFQLHTTKSSAQIIDVRYVEENSSKSNKYEFDLLGLKSICRNIKINSRIFESQSTMIAIAAQNNNNIGDIYSSTQVYFNKGLIDRLVDEKRVWKNQSDKEFIETLYANISQLGYYLRTKVMGDDSVLPPITTLSPSLPAPTVPPAGAPVPVPATTPTPTGVSVTTAVSPKAIIVPKPEEIANAVAVLRSFLYQLRGDDLKYKAIIPFELEITLDGIAGMVQGQIFTINSNILPESYTNSDIGFIITGISHTLQNNDWTTIIKTQICILDPDNKPYNQVNYEYLIRKLIARSQQNEKSVYLILAIIDYLTFMFIELSPINIKDGSCSGGLAGSVGSFEYDRWKNDQIKIPSTTFSKYVQNVWYPAKTTELATVGINSYNELVTVGGQTFDIDMVDYLTYNLGTYSSLFAKYKALKAKTDPDPLPSSFYYDQNLRKIQASTMFIGRTNSNSNFSFDLKAGGTGAIPSEANVTATEATGIWGFPGGAQIPGNKADLIKYPMPKTVQLFNDADQVADGDRVNITVNGRGTSATTSLTSVPSPFRTSSPSFSRVGGFSGPTGASSGTLIASSNILLDRSAIWAAIADDISNSVLRKGNPIPGATNFTTTQIAVHQAASKVTPLSTAAAPPTLLIRQVCAIVPE
jgi:hypothetical protein